MKFSDWLDHRTGYRNLVTRALHEPIPGGARWRYVWGSTLAFVFAVQVITGVLLMTVYSPSATTAWASVWFIQTEMGLGWLIRGLHHFGSQAMVILLPLHILQVVFAGAYRAPREVNWWVGLGLGGIVLALGLTGYLLPWDQKGYWATQVATNIVGLTPLVGDWLQKLLIGGVEYGHLTLTRFYTLHVMVLPATLVLLLIVHLGLFRRHGVTYNPRHAGLPEGTFWPEQLLKDAIACLVVLVLMAGAAVYVHLRGDHLLDAPADPSAANYPARPEWYFLFLFQMLKYFEGPRLEVLGAIGIPTAVLLVLIAIPLLEKIMWRWLAHGLTVLFCVGLVGGAAWLTVEAIRADRDPGDEVIAAIHAKLQQKDYQLTPEEQALLRARQFNQQRRQASIVAERAIALARENGIPPAGPLELVNSDPIIRGPQLFAAHCAACHRVNGTDGQGVIPLEPATASDLGGFGTRAWIRRLLEDPMGHDHFGLMFKPAAEGEEPEPAHTRMATWLEDVLAENESEADRRALLANFDAVAAYLEDESQHPGRLENIPAEALLTTRPAGTAPAADLQDSPAHSPPAAATDSASAATGETAAASPPVAAAPRGGRREADTVKDPTGPPPPSHTMDPSERLIRQGRLYFLNVCNECHSYGGERSGTIRAPEMRGYASVEWIERMIENPAADDLYRSTGREPAQMPSFADKLTPQQRRLIAQWLRTTRVEH